MKIRIFALAKELGLDSKELIEHCNSAGVKLKNSALASISPEERDVVLQYLEAQEPSSNVGTAEAPLSPLRMSPRDVSGKIRSIPTAPLRPRTARKAQAQAADAGVAEGASTGIAEPPEPPPTGEETEAAEPAVPAEGDDADIPPDTSEDVVAVEEKSTDKIVPVSRDDYIAAPGAMGGRMREMKPRGTVASAEPTEMRQPKPKARPALPNIAAPPTYKPPVTKRAEKPKEQQAQKPDIPLTAEVLEQQSPLRAHLQQKKTKKSLGSEPSDLREAAHRAAGQEVRQQRRDKRKSFRQSQQDSGFRSRGPRRRRQKSTVPVDLPTEAQIEFPITVRGLSEAMGRPAKQLLRILFDKGQMVTINENVTEELALEIGLEIGVDLHVKQARDIEEELVTALETDADDAVLTPRPPIVTILGHVDHGKTTLLDKIREADVAGGEAGGITQHIAAYQVEHSGQKTTFVDTPGHAAFGEMRARGANVTDIVVLVVAADDGVMPQTVECISHAKAAGVPIVVAMNKTDLPDTNEQRVLQDLAANDVLPAEWGGDVEVVRTSALSGQGIDDLLETILLTAELQEFKTDANRPAIGVCLEAFRDEGRGALAWFVVQKGTLRIGDVVLCGPAYGRVRAMYNDRDEEIQEAGPSVPLKVAGLDSIPGAGDHFFVMSDIEEARETAELRRDRGRTKVLAGRGRPRTLEDILETARGGTTQDLPLIIKADSPGSIEAIRGELDKFDHPEVRIEIVHDGVGGVNESDVSLASASGAIIVAFHVIAEDRAEQLALQEGVDVRRFDIIYEVTETIKRSLEGLLRPERVQVTTGRALVLRTFHVTRFGTIAGCRVLSGTIERSNRVHVIREQTILNDYNIASLRREKDDVKEVREGMECGIRLDGFNDIKEGDLLEAFRTDEIKRTLDGT